MIEIDVIVPVALKEVFADLGPGFRAASGIALRRRHMLNPEVPGAAARGVPWDLALTNPPYADAMVRAGLAEAGSAAAFGRSPLALAARGAAHGPPPRTAGSVRRVLRAAKAIAITDAGTSGAAFRVLARRLGLRKEEGARVLALEGGGPMRALLAGEADLAVLPLTNVAPVRGVHAAAICPPVLGAHIDLTLCLRAGAPDGARTLASWLLDPARDARLAALGVERSRVSEDARAIEPRGLHHL